MDGIATPMGGIAPVTSKQDKDQFARIPWSLIDSQEYAALSPRAVQVLLILWRQFNGFNNGEIPLGSPRAARLCRCGQKTAWRAFQEIIDAGIATITDLGRPLPDGSNRESRWRINHVKNQPKRDSHK
jgi:hypothetical protein